MPHSAEKLDGNEIESEIGLSLVSGKISIFQEKMRKITKNIVADIRTWNLTIIRHKRYVTQ
jgi:hypothetical protein